MSGMSFLERLLDGAAVEWKPLGDLGEFVRGSGLQKSDLRDSGIGCIHYGQIYTFYGDYAYQTKSFVSPTLATKLRKAQKNDLIIATTSENIEDVCTTLVWLGEEEVCLSGETYIFKHNQNPKYLAYYLKTPNFFDFKKRNRTGTKVIRVHGDKLATFQIPIPCPDNPDRSLAIQAEIVRILDTFTELTRELTRELTLRKKQYEYYRDRLLTFEEGEVEWKPLGNLTLPTKNIRWKETDRSYRYIDLTSVSRENKSIIETLEISALNAPSRAQKLVEKDDVIFATTRPTQLRLCLIDEEYSGEVASTGYCVLRAKTDEILPKWIYYHLSSSKFFNYVEENQSGSAYPAISDSKVKEFKLPIPSLEEQSRIVAILDKFDTLTTSIREGLPREIALRQQQYEYYRDLLLTFPKVEEEQ